MQPRGKDFTLSNPLVGETDVDSVVCSVLKCSRKTCFLAQMSSGFLLLQRAFWGIQATDIAKVRSSD